MAKKERKKESQKKTKKRPIDHSTPWHSGLFFLFFYWSTLIFAWGFWKRNDFSVAVAQKSGKVEENLRINLFEFLKSWLHVSNLQPPGIVPSHQSCEWDRHSLNVTQPVGFGYELVAWYTVSHCPLDDPLGMKVLRRVDSGLFLCMRPRRSN